MGIPDLINSKGAPELCALTARAPRVRVSIAAALSGVWLAIDGLAWVILSLTGILLPQYYDKVFTYAQPASFGEVAFMLWLVINGARSPALDATASSSAVS